MRSQSLQLLPSELHYKFFQGGCGTGMLAEFSRAELEELDGQAGVVANYLGNGGQIGDVRRGEQLQLGYRSGIGGDSSPIPALQIEEFAVVGGLFVGQHKCFCWPLIGRIGLGL